jgi:hypothetical protein
MKFLLRLFVASLIFTGGWALFRLVLPLPAACVLAVVLAIAELLAPAMVSAGAGGFGGGLRLFVRMGATVISWPVFAWMLEVAGMTDRPARIALAAAAASAAGVLAAGHGSGKDTVRLWAVTAAVALPAYAAMQALLVDPVDPLAVAAASVAVVVGLLVARQAIVWPTNHSRVLVTAAGAVALAGAFAGALAFL